MRILGLGLLATFAFPADDWSQATRLFQAALAAQDDARLEQAAAKVAADNSARAVELLLKAARTAPPSPYWILIAALSKITQPAALEAMAEEALRGKVPELRRDLVMSFRLCESPAAVEPLMRLVREGPPELQVSALDELVDRGHLAVIPLLIELAEKDPREEKELNRRFLKAIRALTRDLPPGGPATWRAWWEKKSPDAKPEPSDPGPRKVGQTVVETLRRTRLTDYEDLKKVPKEDILVVKGEYDSVQDLLTNLGIPHQVITYDAIRALKDPYASCLAVFVNCGAAMGDWSPQTSEKVREFVARGGYLFSTDLTAQHLVNRAFPGYLELRGSLSGQIATILPHSGSTGHPLLRGVDIPLTTVASRLSWTIDEGGPALGYDSKRVIPLIESPELAKKRKPPATALTFLPDVRVAQETPGHGGVYEVLDQLIVGRVVCVLSHFNKQRSKEDSFTLQNLLINFLIEAKDRKAMRRDPKDPKK
jgi:hypothetical protein